MTEQKTYWVIKDVITKEYFAIFTKGMPEFINHINQAALCLSKDYAIKCISKIKESDPFREIIPVKTTRTTKEI